MESSGKNSEYQIDDILEEARQLKLKHLNQPVTGSGAQAGSGLSSAGNGQGTMDSTTGGEKSVSMKKERLAQLEKEFSPAFSSAQPIKPPVPTMREESAIMGQESPEPPKPTITAEQQKPVPPFPYPSKVPPSTQDRQVAEELHKTVAVKPQPLTPVSPANMPKAQPLNPVRTVPSAVPVEDGDIKVYVPKVSLPTNPVRSTAQAATGQAGMSQGTYGPVKPGLQKTNVGKGNVVAPSSENVRQGSEKKGKESSVPAVKMPSTGTKGKEINDITDDIDDLNDLDNLVSLYSVMENGTPENESDRLEAERRIEAERKKKAENFHLSAGLRLSGEEEVNDPSEEPEVIEGEDEEIEDYTGYADTEAVRSELVYRRRTGWVQVILTGLIALILIGGAVLEYLSSWSVLSPDIYVGLNIFLLGVATVINPACVGDGLLSFIKFRATAESAVSVSALLALLQTAAQILDTRALTTGNAIVLAPVGALALFFGAFGNQMHLLRICSNFTFASYPGEKYAAHIIEESAAASEIGRSAVALGDPVVGYFERTDFISKFLENSYEDDAGSRAMRVFMPCLFFASLILAAYYVYAGGTILHAMAIFAGAVCLSAPASLLTVSNFPLFRASRRVLRHGAMLVGWKAAADFSGIHALAVDALELFPSESVLLHGIKTFSGTRIDKAILDAAAVSIAAGGPLSSVFRRVIQNRTDILQPVDTLVYEQDMGMSGWVGGRRVLIGNRRLLENHGVDVPSHDYEARYTKEGRHIVYLSTAGELSAMFLVSYVADEGIAKAIKVLVGAHVTLLVRTCDPNITEELICDAFHINPYYVEIMGASAGRCYGKLVSEKSEQSDAVLASNGRLEGEAVGITCCRRLSGAVHLGVALQIIFGALGFAMFVFLSLSDVLLPSFVFPAYVFASGLIAWALPALHRV